MKSLIVAPIAVAASLAIGLTVGAASASNRPVAGNAVLTSSIAGDAATLDEFLNVVPSSLTGAASLSVSESSASPIVMANIDLPEGMTFESGDYSLTGECNTTNARWSFQDRSDLTVKGISCVDGDDANATIDFVLSVDNAVIENTITAAGDYDLESQYRTNDSRKVKANTWIAQLDAGVVLATPAG